MRSKAPVFPALFCWPGLVGPRLGRIGLSVGLGIGLGGIRLRGVWLGSIGFLWIRSCGFGFIRIGFRGDLARWRFLGPLKG